MRVRSRLSGKESVLSKPTILASELEIVGRWSRLVPEGLDEPVRAEFIGRWPETLDLLAVERVVEPIRNDTSWSAWEATLPLVPKIGPTARLQDFDRLIVRLLPHLQHVCYKPRLHLRLEEERLPISRARRSPERATAVLASHPEDWEHRTLRSVRPSRVLATQVEDQWDLYENRVAVRLVDHLLRHVGGRVDELKRIQEMFEEGNDFQDETRGSHRRGRRLFELWGSYFDDNALTRELSDTLTILEGVLHNLRSLLDSPLYRQIPRNVSVALTLRATNILVNDPHYRKVADLWREWAKHGHNAEPTREELRKKRQEQCRDFDAFVQLAIVRALSDLGFAPTHGGRLDGRLALESPVQEISLGSTPDGAIHIEDGVRRLRVVPLLSGFASDELPILWQQLSAEGDDDLVVALLGRPGDFRSEAPTVDRALAGWDVPWVLVISPWSIDSVERTARVIGSWLASQRGASYPPKRIVRPDPGVPLPPWLRRVVNEVLAVRPATEVEIRGFEKACEQRRTQLQGEELRARTTRQRFDPGTLNSLVPLLEVAREAVGLGKLALCPVCGEDSAAGFEERVKERSLATWWCRCNGCGAEWGTRACQACAKAYPVLVPALKLRHPGEENPAPGWIDRYYGRDVWAEPCWRPERSSFRCPHCGGCAGGGCGRCEQPVASEVIHGADQSMSGRNP